MKQHSAESSFCSRPARRKCKVPKSFRILHTQACPLHCAREITARLAFHSQSIYTNAFPQLYHSKVTQKQKPGRGCKERRRMVHTLPVWTVIEFSHQSCRVPKYNSFTFSHTLVNEDLFWLKSSFPTRSHLSVTCKSVPESSAMTQKVLEAS